MSQHAQLAFVFPGQGSQSLDMLADCLDHPIALDHFERADAALGYSLSTLIKEGPLEKLNDTAITQPALLTVSTILWEIYRANNGPTPRYLAGHSLGEYSALVAAGVIAFEDAVALVAKRGAYMQEAVPAGVGAMAAIIGMDDDAVIQLCEGLSTEEEPVSAVNFNSPGQVVIAGKKGAIERACEAAKEQGARRALPLPVSVPSHCQLMKPAADRLAEALGAITFNVPTIEVLHNVDVSAHQDPDAIRQILVKQLYQPVRWTETIESFAKNGVESVVECGAGRVLVGLIRRIDRNLSTYNISDQASVMDVISEIS